MSEIYLKVYTEKDTQMGEKEKHEIGRQKGIGVSRESTDRGAKEAEAKTTEGRAEPRNINMQVKVVRMEMIERMRGRRCKRAQ